MRTSRSDQTSLEFGDFTSDAEGCEVEILFRSHRAAVERYLRRITGDTERARDLCQETFLRALSSKTFQPERGSSRAWLITIARNLFFSDSRKRRPTHISEFAIEQLPAPDETDRDLLEIIRDAANSLPEPERTIVILKHFEDATLHSIAARLDISERTVSRRILHAYELLKGMLTSRGVDLQGGLQ